MVSEKVVWKYALELTAERQKFNMPIGARTLTAQMQNGVITVWCLLYPLNPDAVKVFHIVGTGHGTVELGDQYIGTVQDDRFVWHVFESPYRKDDGE